MAIRLNRNQLRALLTEALDGAVEVLDDVALTAELRRAADRILGVNGTNDMFGGFEVVMEDGSAYQVSIVRSRAR